MLKKEIEIDGRLIPFRASATVPRLYRAKFQRDIFVDLSRLSTASRNTADDKNRFEITDLEIFENVAYIMAKHADPQQPETADEWLDQFDMLSIYTVLPELLELWKLDTETMVDNKKKSKQVQGR